MNAGKNVRKKLLSSFNIWMKVDEEKVRTIGEIVQMLHNASLLLDDIEDNSILRRGIPVAHKIFGNFPTVSFSLGSSINDVNQRGREGVPQKVDKGEGPSFMMS